jgi:preprotein translocase subunit SecY
MNNIKLQKRQEPSLASRLILTILLLTVIRLGNFIPLPYIDRETFRTLLTVENVNNNPVAQILTTFSGSGTSSLSLLSLGILPYINASIIIQLLTNVLPSLKKLQKDEGEYGRRRITELTRYLTFVWAIIQSIGVTYSLKSLVFDWNFWTAAQIGTSLTAGSMIVLWFSELITRKGLGNGSSLLICFNIVSNLPDQLSKFSLALKDKTIFISLVVLSLFLLTTIACTIINEAMIRIPLLSPRQLLSDAKVTSPTNPMKSLTKNILPLRVNQSGVMPLVFTSSTMVILSSISSFILNKISSFNFVSTLFVNENSIFYWGGKIVYWLIYALLIFFFTEFYSTLVLDPKDVEEQFRKNSVSIRGIAPGTATREYLSQTLQKLTAINAIFLIGIIISLTILENLLNLDGVTGRGFGLTSQIILVNVLIDTIRRVQGFLETDSKF